jgi:prophage antirepressor-like protein
MLVRHVSVSKKWSSHQWTAVRYVEANRVRAGTAERATGGKRGPGGGRRVGQEEEENMRAQGTSQLAVFEGKRIRKTLHEGQGWFSIIDVIEALVGGDRPRKYWNDLKKKLVAEGYVEVSEKIGQLKLVAPDGKQRQTDCANTETLFRIIQSVPSPRVEPLKRWLARVGRERIEEIENPELAMARMQEIYEKKGYPKEWIDKRLRGIAVRQDLTDEWQNRGARSRLEYAILTNEIMQGAFGLKVDEYKQVKALERENLRDHMTDLELILTMLAEATTTKLHRGTAIHKGSLHSRRTPTTAARWLAGRARILKHRPASRSSPARTSSNWAPRLENG